MKIFLTRWLAVPLLTLCLLIPPLTFSGCSTPERTVLNTVIASRMAVGEALEVFKSQVRAGKVDRDTYDKANTALTTYKRTSTAALNALKTYEKTGDKSAWDQATTVAAQAQADLINILAPFVPGLK